MMTKQEALREIQSSLQRRKGTFAVTPSAPGQLAPYALAVGALDVVEIAEGFVVSLGLQREQLEKLRAMCDELLK